MRVVFDTNVVVSACFWRSPPFDCLGAWAQGRCSAAASAPLLAEYEETLEELLEEYAGRPWVDWVGALRDAADLIFPVERAMGATPDPRDEMVLECALAAEADCIVSGDKKHLLRLRRFRDIAIVNPVTFLRLLAG